MEFDGVVNQHLQVCILEVIRSNWRLSSAQVQNLITVVDIDRAYFVSASGNSSQTQATVKEK